MPGKTARQMISHPRDPALQRTRLRGGQDAGHERGEIERARGRVLDEPVHHAIDSVAARLYRRVDVRQARSRDIGAGRDEKAFAFLKLPVLARSLPSRGRGDQAIVVDGITRALHRALPSAGRTPVEIGNVDWLAVIGLDILLGRHRHLVNCAIEEVDDRRRVDDAGLADGPVAGPSSVLLVPGVGVDDRVTKAERFIAVDGVDGNQVIDPQFEPQPSNRKWLFQTSGNLSRNRAEPAP